MMHTYPRVCPECDIVYATETAFWKHFIGGEKGTLCLDYDEKKARGWSYYQNGWRTWEEVHEPNWDKNRQHWSVLFDPAMIFDDLFPEPAPEVKWWQKLSHVLWYTWHHEDKEKRNG